VKSDRQKIERGAKLHGPPSTELIIGVRPRQAQLIPCLTFPLKRPHDEISIKAGGVKDLFL
jgi:hypothetical protein